MVFHFKPCFLVLCFIPIGASRDGNIMEYELIHQSTNCDNLSVNISFKKHEITFFPYKWNVTSRQRNIMKFTQSGILLQYIRIWNQNNLQVYKLNN